MPCDLLCRKAKCKSRLKFWWRLIYNPLYGNHFDVTMTSFQFSTNTINYNFELIVLLENRLLNHIPWPVQRSTPINLQVQIFWNRMTNYIVWKHCSSENYWLVESLKNANNICYCFTLNYSWNVFQWIDFSKTIFASMTSKILSSKSR